MRLLGSVGATRGGRQLELTAGSRPLAVLSLLGLRVGQWVSVDELIDGVWDGEGPTQARHALHVFVSALRHELGHESIVTRRGGGYRLDLPDELVDAILFKTLVKRSNGDPPARVVGDLRKALDLWHGAALAGAAPSLTLQ